MHAYINTYVHTCIHTKILIRTWKHAQFTNMHKRSTHEDIWNMHECFWAYKCTWINLCIHMHMHLCAHTHAHVYSLFLWILLLYLVAAYGPVLTRAPLLSWNTVSWNIAKSWNIEKVSNLNHFRISASYKEACLQMRMDLDNIVVNSQVQFLSPLRILALSASVAPKVVCPVALVTQTKLYGVTGKVLEAINVYTRMYALMWITFFFLGISSGFTGDLL